MPPSSPESCFLCQCPLLTVSTSIHGLFSCADEKEKAEGEVGFAAESTSNAERGHGRTGG